MARPKPKVLIEYTDKNFRNEQILEAEAIYAVFYQGRAFNLKSFSTLVDYTSAKYKKTSFANPGHAFNLADRLNKKFNTDDFKVVQLVNGIIIEEESDQGNYGLLDQ